MELGCRIGKVIGQKPLPRFDVFNVRVLVGLDKLFRKKRRYQRDLSASINDTLLAVNLNTVKLVTVEGKKKQTARETQVVIRSEEHTSELQSQSNLVCRLLLEKKKT